MKNQSCSPLAVKRSVFFSFLIVLMAGFQMSVFANDVPSFNSSTATTNQPTTTAPSTSTTATTQTTTSSTTHSFLAASPLSTATNETAGLVRDYTFNAGLGLLQGSATSTVDAAPTIYSNPKALSFNGTTNAVKMDIPNHLNAFPGSVSVWVKTTQRTNGGIINKFTSMNGYKLYISGGTVGASYFRDAQNSVRGLKGGSISDGKWHHIVFSLDQNGGALYVDGQLKSTMDWQGLAGKSGTTEDLWIGSGFRGSMDELKIYEKKLNDSEISLLAQRKDSVVTEPLPTGPLPMRGALRVSKVNPRYFTDENGRAIYLTGSHTWTNLTDRGTANPPAAFDYTGYLNMMKENHQNFMRLWRWEFPKFKQKDTDPYSYTSQQPWATVPGTAGTEGRPKFDLTKFNESYFTRLRQRVIAAKEKGIYVSVMLFEGFELEVNAAGWAWHPFNIRNNVNGVNGDTNGDGKGKETHTLNVDPLVTRLQEAYVKKVIDTVGDLDNVLYEVANETVKGSMPWQNHIAAVVTNYEKTKSKQHPVGITVPYWNGEYSRITSMDSNIVSWTSPEQPNGTDPNAWKYNPPAGDGKKVVLSDTDHLWGRGGTVDWIWKTFTRGHNVIYMDNMRSSDNLPFVNKGETASGHIAMRKNMGYTLDYAKKMDLIHMTPQTSLCSTGYCLASRGQEYLVYQPGSGGFSVNLSDSAANFSVEWFNPATGQKIPAGKAAGGSSRQFTPPFTGDAVLYLKRI